MKFDMKILLLGSLFAAGVSLAVDNPIGVRLGGALVQHNGTYYAMGAETNGQLFASADLVNWGSPAQIVPADVAGPYELMYRNGLFYLFAQNRGFCVSPQPQTNFTELVSGGISGEDMRLYQDEGGAIFSVNRRYGNRKGEKNGGEIWMQLYSSPWKTAGRAGKLLDGRRGMWDSVDSSNLGEPEIMKYRDAYYLLYGANNPSPRSGLREIGVAVNENAAKIENENKVRNPVLTRNSEQLQRKYKVILPTGEFGKWEGRFTVNPPKKGWALPEGDLEGFRTGEGGFGFPDEADGAQLFACRTKWRDDQIWIRRAFELRGKMVTTPVLKIRHEGAVQVFLNGKKVYESISPSVAYRHVDITEKAKELFREGENILAVFSKSPEKAEYRFIDFGLLDAEGAAVEPLVCGLNTPRIITGPNGFEKWMTYGGYWNGQPGTGLDRVFFFDKEMVVDGPTTAQTEGYHPPPAMPTFSDGFTNTTESAWTNRWVSNGGEWGITNSALRQANSRGEARLLLKLPAVTHYLFETGIRFPADPDGGEVGVVAWTDGQNELAVKINPYRKTWRYQVQPGGSDSKSYQLPAAFELLETPPGMELNARPLHKLKVVKNAGYFDVYLDEIKLTLKMPIRTKFGGAGVPGLFCQDSPAEFDGVTFTAGWDEHDEYITGWGAAADGTSPGGEWQHDRDRGLRQKIHSEAGRAFKGDLLDQYEFCVNAELEKFEDGFSDYTYGVFPVFADKDNYLKAMINARRRELVVSGMLNGKPVKQVTKPLATQIEQNFLYDENTPHRDVISWMYRLRSQSVISGFDVLWFEGKSEHLQNEFFVPSDDMDIRFAQIRRGIEIKPKDYIWEESRFKEADQPKPKEQVGGIYNRIDLREEEANYLGFGIYTTSSETTTNSVGQVEYIGGYNESDTPSRPLKTLISVEVESSYFFRCVKLKDKVIIELNGRPMVEIEGEWPPSQVGLLTEGQPCYFNGITLMHLPENKGEIAPENKGEIAPE